MDRARDGVATTAPRRAGPDDAPALTALRAVMLDAMGENLRTDLDPAWHAATTTWFRERLADEWFAAFVVDDLVGGGEHGPVSCAIGVVSAGAPVPGGVGRPAGSVFSVATDPRARRRGHARACVTAVLDWLDRHHVVRTDLGATPDAIALYRDLGFVARPWTSMRRA